MNKLAEKYPKLFASGALLLGSMGLSAATYYGYQSFSVDLSAQPACVGRHCDAEDIDDCGGNDTVCSCNDSVGLCEWDGPPL